MFKPSKLLARLQKQTKQFRSLQCLRHYPARVGRLKIDTKGLGLEVEGTRRQGAACARVYNRQYVKKRRRNSK